MAVSWPLAAAVSWFKGVFITESVMQANVTDPLNDLNNRLTPFGSAAQLIRGTAVTVGPSGTGRGTASGSNPFVVSGYSGAPSKSYGQMTASVSNGTITAPVTGLYEATGSIDVPATTVTGRLVAYFAVNGTPASSELGDDGIVLTNAGPLYLSPRAKLQLNAGDQVTLEMYCTNSANITPIPNAFELLFVAS